MRTKWLITGTIAVSASAVLLTFVLLPFLINPTRAKCNQIAIGMNRDEVEAILGPQISPAQWTEDGKLIGLQSRWLDENGVVVVTYGNDLRVIQKDWYTPPDDRPLMKRMLYPRQKLRVRE